VIYPSPKEIACSSKGERPCWLLARRALPLFLIASVLVAVYLPLAVRRSAWSDDYPMVFNGFNDKLLSEMRPVAALVYSVFLRLVD
ncbi:uncharacterized protein METZ01_LOCUS286161, partial [marine metagenome]